MHFGQDHLKLFELTMTNEMILLTLIEPKQVQQRRILCKTQPFPQAERHTVNNMPYPFSLFIDLTF
jgi:hypothetical protein